VRLSQFPYLFRFVRHNLQLAMLVAPEVVLDEERGVEPLDGHLIAVGWQYHLVEQLRSCFLPQFHDDFTQLLVGHHRVACSPAELLVR